MKLSLAILSLALSVPAVLNAQDSLSVVTGEYPNTYSSGSANVSMFTQESKRFNDWAISIGAGVPFMQSSDLTSIKNGNGKTIVGYSAYLSVDKAITHAFGLKLQYDRGETRQGFFNTRNAVPTNVPAYEQVAGRTQYDGVALIADLNVSNLLRRVDNKSPYRWALHLYGGPGILNYRSYLKDVNGQRLVTDNDLTIYGQAGGGVKYKINNRIDLEGRATYVITGSDTFDGGDGPYINNREDQVSDNFLNATLGLTFKLGKHDSHLMWHDPLQEIYYRVSELENKSQDLTVCKAGDADNDGVCDDWDRQLDSPAGARVDGAGVALDVDLDGVIDLYDKCVTVPGPVENGGCPMNGSTGPVGAVTETETKLDGIEFDFNSDRILPNNTPILNSAVNYINSSDGTYTVVGATDTVGSDEYNQKLSERRANSVKSYLLQNGVSSGKINAVGRGEKDLKYPECEPASNCPEWKNRANRRVYFEAK